MKGLKKQNIRLWWTVILIIIWIALAVWWARISYTSRHDINVRFSAKLTKVYNNIENEGEDLAYIKDSLVKWSTNTIPINDYPKKHIFPQHGDTPQIIELKNGYYLHKSKQNKDTTFHYFYLIKNKYDVTNRYISNAFNSPFDLDEKVSLTSYPTALPIKINGKNVGYLDASEECLKPSESEYFVFYLWLSINIFLVVIYMLNLFIRWAKKSRTVTLWIISIYIIYIGICVSLCLLTPDFSTTIITPNVNYKNILIFVEIGLSAFLAFYFIKNLLHIHRRGKYFISKQLLLLLSLSVLGGVIAQYFSTKYRRESVENMAEKLIKRNKENNFESVKILLIGAEKDSEVIKLINDGNLSGAENYINSYYLSLLQEDFHTGLLIYDQTDSIVIEPSNIGMKTSDYVNARLLSAKKIKNTNNFFVQDDYEDNKTFLFLDKIDGINIFAECLERTNSRNMNYSRLMLREPNTTATYKGDILPYSKYVNDSLVYSYSSTNKILPKRLLGEGWHHESGSSVYQKSEGNVCFAIYVPSDVLYNILNAISMIFLLLIVLFGCEYIISKIPYIKNFSLNIKSSILLALIGTFLVNIIIIGVFSVRSLKNLNEKNNMDILTEKTTSIKLEIEKMLTRGSNINESNVIELSNEFLTDINLWDRNGYLAYTSHKKIFDKGYLINRMEYNALTSLRQNSENLYRNEKIGRSEFIASYSPIFSPEGKAIYYLNIPFINQQKTMTDNIYTMMNNFVNMFMFWINIAVVIFIFLSNLITKPFEIVKERLSKITIGKKNEKIVWEKDDEMGELVNTYNDMIDKIEQSSILLKQQERLSSWKEIAKQIAHEIKNPLTPMKLSIQYLQKLYEQKPEMFDNKWREIAPSLISQIETISTITSELNNYSHPMVEKERIDLNKCILSSINLFANNHTAQIIYNERENMFVLGNESLYIRIFNNLLKNSLQSFGDRDDGEIEINAEDSSTEYVICIKDNGSGIKEENKSKIFNENFTTKSQGGGIGLTIVKGILEEYDASISFQSKEHYGTTFFIRFNKA